MVTSQETIRIGLFTPMNENIKRTAEYRTRNRRRMNTACSGPAKQPKTSHFDIPCSIFDICFFCRCIFTVNDHESFWMVHPRIWKSGHDDGSGLFV